MEAVFGHRGGAKVDDVEGPAVGGEGQIHRTAGACASADGGVFFLRSGAEKHAAAAGFGVEASHLTAVIARGSEDPKNLTGAAKSGGEIGDLLVAAIGRGRGAVLGIAKLAFVIDAGDFLAVPYEKPAILPVKLLHGRLHLVAHDVDLPAGSDAEDARRARFITRRCAGFGDVQIALGIESDAAGIVQEADNNFGVIAGKEPNLRDAGGGDCGWNMIEGNGLLWLLLGRGAADGQQNQQVEEHISKRHIHLAALVGRAPPYQDQ